MAPLSVAQSSRHTWTAQFPAPVSSPGFGEDEYAPDYDGVHRRGVVAWSAGQWSIIQGGKSAARRLAPLATSHKCPGGYLQYASGGSLVKLKGYEPTTAHRVRRPFAPLEHSCDEATGEITGWGVRGRVIGFSYGSRNRLLQKIASLPKSRLERPYFFTLTYPGSFTDDSTLWKRHLRALLKRMWRKCGKCSVIWRLEPQRRGAPHYHCLWFGHIPVSENTLKSWWADIVAPDTPGGPDPWHRTHGFRDLQKIRSWRGVMSYASKYMAKDSELDLPGRQWGIRYEALLLIQLIQIGIPSAAWYAVRRAMYACEHAREGKRPDTYGPHAGMWRMWPEDIGRTLMAYAWSVHGMPPLNGLLASRRDPVITVRVLPWSY